jgi:hypothetical protein
MTLTIASVLNDSHYALGAWQTDQAKTLAFMTQFNTDAELIAYLQQNKANPAVTGPLANDFPQWAVSAMGDQVGSSAAYLNTELAPIIVEAAAMGWDSAHLNNAVQQTPYYQAHNQSQLTWQTKSVADKAAAVDAIQVQMANDVRSFYGPNLTNVNGMDISFNGLRQSAEYIAQGGETYDVWKYGAQRAAESIPNTPASQQITSLARQAGQQTSDVSNLAQQLGNTWRQWVGDTYPPPQDIQRWATDINMNVRSQADFVNLAKQTSQQLYTNKPANLDYASWVTQPKSVISGTLEMPSVADSDLLLQSYLRGNIANLGDLKLAAQQDPRYDATVTARDQATQLGSHLLSTWGLASGPGM